MIKFIVYKGEKLPVRVSYYALKMLKAEKEVSQTENIANAIGEIANDFNAQESLLFYSLKKGHEVAGKEFTFRREDMENVMDEVWQDFMKIVPEFFAPKEKPKDGAKK